MHPSETVEPAIAFSPWITVSLIIFALLLLYFLIKFFSVLFEFVQARGCLTIGLTVIVGLPGVFVLTLLSGYNITSSLLILLALVGLVTGYIARDSEGSVGKFGNFFMIVSIITLVVALFLAKFVIQ